MSARADAVKAALKAGAVPMFTEVPAVSVSAARMADARIGLARRGWRSKSFRLTKAYGWILPRRAVTEASWICCACSASVTFP